MIQRKQLGKSARKFKMNIQDFFLGIWGLHKAVLPLARLFCIKLRFFSEDYYWEYPALPDDQP